MDLHNAVVGRFGVHLDAASPIELQGSRFRSLPRLLQAIEAKSVVEVGVFQGKFTKALCEWLPETKIYGIDPWLDYDEYVESSVDGGQGGLDSNYQKAKDRLSSFGIERCQLIRATSMEAVSLFDDESLDCVFIDGNHSFRYVIDDIASWSKKVRVGGMVAGHDYWNSYEDNRGGMVVNDSTKLRRLCQVKDAVDAWTTTEGIAPWFLLTADRCPTWFWMREK